MSSDLYHNLDAPIPQMAWAKEYGLSKAIWALWDLSLSPANNGAEEEKLGKGEIQHGGAIYKHDTDTNEAQLLDGVPNNGRPGINTRRPLNPENWVFRPHYEMTSNQKNGTWDLRLVAEHENESSSRDNHGTMVMNKKNDALWGWINDVAWVRKTPKGSDLNDDEIKLDGAGYLGQLMGKGAGASKRGAVATPVPRNGGFVTDGAYDGQWNQSGKLVIGPMDDSQDAPHPNGTTTAGSTTVAAGGGGSTGSTTAGNPFGISAGVYGQNGPGGSGSETDVQAGNPFGINAGVYGQNGPGGGGSETDTQAGNGFNSGTGAFGGGNQTQSGNPFGIQAGRY